LIYQKSARWVENQEQSGVRNVVILVLSIGRIITIVKQTGGIKDCPISNEN
jgi:uncharacterized ion transporter superfamily protein YfcC